MEKKLQIHDLGKLFEQVQMDSVFADGKTFVDCVPKQGLELIQQEYESARSKAAFDLRVFVQANFDLPDAPQNLFHSDASKSAEQHIHELWSFLTRTPSQETSSIIPLPKPYVVPGGRFREIYYWDSYFTMLGLEKSGRFDLIANMVENFAYLIENVGYIPNGNRTYFMGRSQPPFFSLMIKLLSQHEPSVITKFLPQLEKEYSFWMRGLSTLREGESVHRVVKFSDGAVLNRYWDENDTPRPESYKEDVELSHQSSQRPNELFRNLRAAAESGWDFSSRWYKVEGDFGSIHTSEIIPVDLNCLLLHLEETLHKANQITGNEERARIFHASSQKRKAAIQKYCWHDKEKFYFDYDFKSNQLKSAFTLAGFFPLFFKVADVAQASSVAGHLQYKFLKSGGLTTTLVQSGQQWDAPNGWAPLQWICFKGLLNYNFNELAAEVRKRWLAANDAVFKKSGKMTEKYDVWNENADASGGEYPNQDGFGWTNGVYLAMKSEG